MSWTAPFRPLLRAGETVLDRVLCVLGAVVFAQCPEFIQQYRQRLGGQLDEARRQLVEFEAVATHAKLTLPQFIDRTHANADTSVASLADVMQGALQRVENLSAAAAALSAATLWEKPFVFFSHIDLSLAQSTLQIYQPAVPTTAEGLVYAVAGMLVFLGAYHGLIRYPITAAIARRHQLVPRKNSSMRSSTLAQR